MKNFMKKTLCIILCVLVMATSFTGVAVAGNSSPYPKGVTEKDALNAVVGTDKLINELVPMFTSSNLSKLVLPEIYNSEVLSSLLLSVYKNLEKNEKDLKSIGVNISVTRMGDALDKYPKVAARLYRYDTWAKVNLDGADWGVRDKESFATAVGDIFSPFNKIIYTLLCSGSYNITKVIKIKGANGYSNAIVPLLKSLDCKNILTQQQFNDLAKKDKSSMVKNIVLPILTLLEQGLKTPADVMTSSLPGFAYFVDSGKFNESLNSLVSPITKNPLVEIAVFLKILDIQSFNINVPEMVNGFLLKASAEKGFKVKPIDFKVLASCGTAEGDSFKADKGKAYIAIMRWLVENLKLNQKKIAENMADKKGGMPIDEKLLNKLLGQETDALVGTVTLLFTPGEISKAENMVYPEITSMDVKYTPNLTEDNYKKVLKGIDPLLDEFMKEGGQYSSVKSAVSSLVYTNNNISSLTLNLYKALEEQGMLPMLKILGINCTPRGVASALKRDGYENAANTLKKYDSWKSASLGKTSWGFSNGSRRGFQKALASVINPLSPLLRVLLAEKDIVILNSITIKGADGYNTAIIPLLEAMGCDSHSIKSYNAYKKRADTKDLIDFVLEPVFDIFDEFGEKPVYTLTEILPNIVYFVNSGSLDKCLSNLMRPVTALSERLAGIYNIKVEVPNVAEKLDLNKTIKGITAKQGVKIADFDINNVAKLGEAEARTSKAQINGEKTTYTYIKSNNLDVLMSALRIVARTLKLPGNDKLLMSSMSGADAGPFEAYSSTLTEKFAAMSEDELIEWLYQLFFKERVKAELVVDEEYQPTIIYTPKEKNYTWLYALGGYLGISLIAAVVLIVNRKKLYGNTKTEGRVC